MRVDVLPRQVDITPGQAIPIAITIANTSTVIGGYAIRILGADPGWVELETEQVSLFPDETRTVTATVTAPHGIPAGLRRVAVQVRELTPPDSTSITQVDLTVPSDRSVQVRLDPVSVTAGRHAAFSVLVENTGNTPVRGRLAGEDPEGNVSFEFDPDVLGLAPGEHGVVDMRASARRRIAGSPTVRVLNIYLDDAPAERFFSQHDEPPVHEERAALATGTFLQKSLLSRGALSLLGLLAAVTVFAIVITIAMSRLVGQSAADRNLALQVAAARNQDTTVGTSGVAGTVRLLTSRQPVPGVSVVVFNVTNTAAPIATTATNDQGAYAVSNLAAGQYKISFRGAGFVQLWYPGAATDADATTITLAAGQQQAGLNVMLGGVPATISGTVTGEDVSAAKLYLETTPVTSATAARTNGARALPVPEPSPPDNGSAVVQSVPIGADGTFTLTNVPSPSIYLLVVVKTGYATSTQRIDVGAGENRTGVSLLLRKGDGLISGTVSGATGPLGNVTITATSGQSSASTVSLTEGTPGAFTLRGLPTPASFTVVASKTGYATQTLTLTLSAGQKLTGVAMTLGQSAGSLRGMVTLLPRNTPAPGVAVTITNGSLTVQTTTESTTHVGQWQVGGLPVPGTYTVTFTRSDLASQTVSVTLDRSGKISAGSQGANVTSTGIAVSMQSATATVYGAISQAGGTTVCDSSNHIAEATVTFSSGASSFTVTSAHNRCGQYRIDHLPPGTYTMTVATGSGTSPTSLVLRLSAGDVIRKNVALARSALMRGKVVGTDGVTPRPGWTVFLYRASEYPSTVLRTTVTSTTGAFGFLDLDAGDYIVAVGPTADPSNAITTKNVTVQPSAVVDNVVIKADP